MDQEWISKKELLEQTDISYGQLYRWKRKDIIPESWFIKKSSYTGQETFFPKEKIIERIEKIKELKDEYSLEELASYFSPNPKEVTVRIDILLKQGMLSQSTWDIYKGFFLGKETLQYQAILTLMICQKAIGIKEDERLNLCRFLLARHVELLQTEFDLIGFEKAGTFFWALLEAQSKWQLEDETKVQIRININEMMNELNVQLSQMHI